MRAALPMEEGVQMSVYSMAKTAQDGAETPNYPVALKDYIPGEALAIYLFAAGILTPAADATKTDIGFIKGFCFVLGLVVVAAITISALDKEKANSGKGVKRGINVSEPNRRRIVVIVLAWSAFTAYVLATRIPAGYELASVELTRFAVVIAAAWAVVLPGVADKLGVRKMEIVPPSVGQVRGAPGDGDD